MFTHARCGGSLRFEYHRKWVFTQPGPHEPLLSDELEELMRCDRCGLVGIAVDTKRRRR